MAQLFDLNGGVEITSLDGAYGFYIVTVDSEGNPVQSGFVTLDTLKTFINTDPSVVPSSNPWRGCQVALSTNFTVANDVLTAVSFEAEAIDTDDIWNVVTPTRLTVPTGVTKVRISANVQWALNATSMRAMYLYKNGAGVPAGSFGSTIPGSPTTGSSSLSAMNGVSGIMEVTSGDYFELRVLNRSGGNLDILSGPRTWFEIEIVEATV